MYEFHGWIKLAESASEIDEGTLERKCNKLRQILKTLDWASGKAELLLLNGIYVLVLNAIPNRKRSEADEMENLISVVTTDFKGSYGIIYEYNEQIKTPMENGAFSVRVIKRGRCETVMDPFLSPVVPVVEDE